MPSLAITNARLSMSDQITKFKTQIIQIKHLFYSKYLMFQDFKNSRICISKVDLTPCQTSKIRGFDVLNRGGAVEFGSLL